MFPSPIEAPFIDIRDGDYVETFDAWIERPRRFRSVPAEEAFYEPFSCPCQIRLCRRGHFLFNSVALNHADMMLAAFAEADDTDTSGAGLDPLFKLFRRRCDLATGGYMHSWQSRNDSSTEMAVSGTVILHRVLIYLREQRLPREYSGFVTRL